MFTGDTSNKQTREQPEKQRRSNEYLCETLTSLGIMRGPIEGPLKHIVHHSTNVLWGSINWSLIMPRDSILSDSEYEFLPFGAGADKYMQNARFRQIIEAPRQLSPRYIGPNLPHVWGNVCLLA